MDVKISGAGVLGGGEYEEVRVSGSARFEGSILCRSFACSGAAKGACDLYCQEDFRSAGSIRVEGMIHAGSVNVSGSLHCGGLAGEQEIRLSGGAVVEGKLPGGEIRVAGSLKAGAGIEAEHFRCSGRLDCQGLLNAETVEIGLGEETNRVTAIGGGTVRVTMRPEGRFFEGLGFPWGKASGCCLTVEESIEADDVELVNTVCPLVTGRRVVVGKGCRIDTVRYGESIEIDPAAQVGKQERI